MVMVVASAIAMLVVIVVMMLVVVASAIAMLVVIVVMMLVVVAIAIAVLVVIVVMMLVVVATAVAVLVVIVVMMLVIVASALTMFVVIVVVMLVIVTSALAMLVVVMVVMFMLFLKSLYRILKSVLVLHGRKNILAVKAIPGSCHDNSAFVMLAKKIYTLADLLISCALCMRKHDRRSVLDLVVIELAKVLHIHLTLVYVGNRSEAIKRCAMLLRGLSRANNVGKLAYARGLNDDSVGIVLLKNLYKRLGKITNQRATDATRIHLGNLNSRISKEATVDTDLTKLILDKNNLLACICFLNKLLNQRGLTCAKEAGKYIYFSHFKSPLNNTFTNNIIP